MILTPQPGAVKRHITAQKTPPQAAYPRCLLNRVKVQLVHSTLILPSVGASLRGNSIPITPNIRLRTISHAYDLLRLAARARIIRRDLGDYTSMTKRRVAFIHTSPAAIAPLMKFYSEAAPELEITNLLDDGILRLLSAADRAGAQERLADMIGVVVGVYQSELAMVTCSSVSIDMVAELDAAFAVPVIKIDHPMARQAVAAGNLVGVAATFQPTLTPTTELIKAAAREAGTEAEIICEVDTAAYDALLSGDAAKHDELLLKVIDKLDARGVATIVLAQVSMARILPALDGRTRASVLSSLQTSLGAIRERLDGKRDDQSSE